MVRFRDCDSHHAVHVDKSAKGLCVNIDFFDGRSDRSNRIPND